MVPFARSLVACSLAVLGVVACSGGGGPAADFTGNYTVAITNKDNGCNYPNWTVGNTASGIPLTVTQSGDSVTGTVTGLTGTYMNLVLGTNTFTGSGSGATVTLTAYGTRNATSGNCAYTTNAIISATLTGDALQGTISYTPKTNGSPDCGALASCASVQAMSGARPPK